MISDLIASYTQQLLSYDAALIVIGRENYRKDDTQTSYILIDELVSVPAGGSVDFDGDTEEQTLSVSMQGSFTLDFYGDDARVNAVKWQALHRGQASYELQRDLGIAIYHATNFRNLKGVEGSQFNERYQIEISVNYNETETVTTLRIDTAETSLIIDN